MPFPPSFTNLWDTTFPLDTELANVIGANLRQLRVDVMQRLSLLSRTLVNRPTPEIANATWGGAGFGLIFIATDTNQIFQWNGTAWVQISVAGGTSDYDDYTPVIFAAVAPGVIRTVNIPVGAVQNLSAVSSFIEIETSFTITGATVPASGYVLKINGTTVLNVGLAANAGPVRTKTTVVISSGTVPRVTSLLQDNLNTASLPAVTRSTLGVIDGTAVVAVQDSFSGATTITATVDYMHIRVRK